MKKHVHFFCMKLDFVSDILQGSLNYHFQRGKKRCKISWISLVSCAWSVATGIIESHLRNSYFWYFSMLHIPYPYEPKCRLHGFPMGTGFYKIFSAKCAVLCCIYCATRWVPTSSKSVYSPYKWPYKWITEGVTLVINGVILPISREPTEGNQHESNTKKHLRRCLPGSMDLKGW